MFGRLQFLSLLRAALDLSLELVAFFRSSVRSRSALMAENLFLRKQLAFYQEHQISPRRLTDAARLSLVFWSRWCNWKSVLVIVKPETLIGWHRRGFKLFWKLKSRPGRPKLPRNIRQLIARMVAAYWPDQPKLGGPSSQRWHSFVRNHAQSMLACDFLVVVTASFRQLYVFVLLEIGRRRILHCNATAHPTAAWTLQQLREAVAGDHGYQYLIHDHDAIFSAECDQQLLAFGLKVLKTPVHAPQANAYCERLIGTMRREFLDFVIPLSERHLRSLLRKWITHYNQSRPHSRLGPGIPEPSNLIPLSAASRHSLPKNCRVVGRPVLGGLHHEYRLKKVAA